jgi:soluble cytochrome b562
MKGWRAGTAWGGLMAAALFAAGAGLAVQPPDRGPGQPGQAPPGGAPRGQPRGDRPFENVEGAMRAINGGLRRLKASGGDPAQKDQSLQAIGRMQAAAVYAKGSTPGDHAPTPAQLEDFRRGQIKLLTLMLECEVAILDGNGEQVKGLIARMESLRDEAHKKFGVGDEDDGGGQ